MYNFDIDDFHTYAVGSREVLVHNSSMEPVKPIQVNSPTVSEILRLRKGSIKQAPLPKGSPSWDSIMHLTMEEIEQLAKQKKPGYATLKKLLEDNRFKR